MAAVMQRTLIRSISRISICSKLQRSGIAFVTHESYPMLQRLAPTTLTKSYRNIKWTQSCRAYSDDKKSAVTTKLLECIKQYDKLTAAELTLESRFKEDLSMDSLDHVEMIMLIEDEFGFEIPDSAAEKMDTPAKILEFVLEKTELAS